RALCTGDHRDAGGAQRLDRSRRTPDPSSFRTAPAQVDPREMSRTTAMTTDRKVADALYRNDFGAFTYQALGALNGAPLVPGWHIDAICHRTQEMVRGRTRRLVLNAPPRSLKSSISSVAF